MSKLQTATIRIVLAVVALTMIVVCVDLFVVQFQLKPAGAPVCSESVKKPDWLSEPISTEAYLLDLKPKELTGREPIFVPAEASVRFDSARKLRG